MQYQIGDFSLISRLSIKTLRYYHECGLLEPSFIDSESGYRFYDQNCLERVKIINELKELDFSLKEIKEILENCKDDSELLSYAVEKSKEIREKVARYNQMQKKLEIFIQRASRNEEVRTKMSREIVVKEIPDLLIASIRFKGKYQDVTPAFTSLFRNYGRYCMGAPFSLYYDHGYKEDGADIEVCLPIRTGVEIDGINCRKLAGGKAVTTIHKGPYETIGSSYKIIIDHLSENQHQYHLPQREVYLKGPGMILPRNPKNYVTEVQFLLEG